MNALLVREIIIEGTQWHIFHTEITINKYLMNAY